MLIVFHMPFITTLVLSLAHLLIIHFCMPLFQPFVKGHLQHTDYLINFIIKILVHYTTTSLIRLFQI